MVSFGRIFVALSSLVGAVLGLAVVSPAAGAEDTTSWTVRTALSQYGSDRSLFSYTVKPGGTVTDGIDIANQGSEPITLKIYAADGFTSDTGGFDVLTPDKDSETIGSWLTPSAATITVPGGKEVQIPFTLTVPETATPGDYMGGIVTVLEQKDDSQNGTVIHQRVGLRVKARVSGTLTPKLEIENFKVNFDGSANPFGTGKATLTYTVHNTGNAVLGGQQTAKVEAGFGGSSASLELDRLPDLLPGETWDATVPIDEVKAMVWVSGEVTVTPVLTDAAGSTSTLEPMTASDRVSVSAWSWVILIGAVVLLVLVVWLLVFGIGRRRRASKARVEAEVEAKVEAKLEAKVAAALKDKDGEL